MKYWTQKQRRCGEKNQDFRDPLHHWLRTKTRISWKKKKTGCAFSPTPLISCREYDCNKLIYIRYMNNLVNTGKNPRSGRVTQKTWVARSSIKSSGLFQIIIAIQNVGLTRRKRWTIPQKMIDVVRCLFCTLNRIKRGRKSVR